MRQEPFANSPIRCVARGGCGHDDLFHYESWREGNARSIACRECDKVRGKCWEPIEAYRRAAS